MMMMMIPLLRLSPPQPFSWRSGVEGPPGSPGRLGMLPGTRPRDVPRRPGTAGPRSGEQRAASGGGSSRGPSAGSPGPPRGSPRPPPPSSLPGCRPTESQQPVCFLNSSHLQQYFHVLEAPGASTLPFICITSLNDLSQAPSPIGSCGRSHI